MVRTQNSVTVLQIYFRTQLSSQTANYFSRKIATVDMQMGGGCSIIAFAVNPWSSNQIAIINTAGQWGLWGFIPKRSHRTGFLQPPPCIISSGRIPESSDIPWADICWGKADHLIIFATRSDLYQVNLQARPLLYGV